MVNKITYLLIPASFSLSVAMAEPSEAFLLSANQMDQVTAGLSSSVDAFAVGVSPVFAVSGTSTVAITALTGNGNPGLTGGGAIAGGLALAGAAGDGSSTTTSVTPTTDVTGPNAHSISLNTQSSGDLVSMSGGAIVAINAPTANPL